MNISLTKKQEDYISEQLAFGDFQNASELVRDALRLHQLYRLKAIDDLKKEIEKGWTGDSVSTSVAAIVKKKKAKMQM